MHRPRGDGVCSLPAQQRLDQSRTVGAGAGSPRTAAVPGLGAGSMGSAAQPGRREQPGVPQCFGKWGEACKGCRWSGWRPQGWDGARGSQLGRSAEPGLSTTFQDRHWQREARTWPGGAPSKQQLYSQHRSLAPLHGFPSPKNTARRPRSPSTGYQFHMLTGLLSHEALGSFFPHFGGHEGFPIPRGCASSPHPNASPVHTSPVKSC